MTQSQSPSSAARVTPEQLNKITAQLRALNKAYQAAVEASGKCENGEDDPR